jgi:hypothetical protein
LEQQKKLTKAESNLHLKSAASQPVHQTKSLNIETALCKDPRYIAWFEAPACKPYFIFLSYASYHTNALPLSIFQRPRTTNLKKSSSSYPNKQRKKKKKIHHSQLKV